MVSLTGDITKQIIVDRYEDFVTATANASIVWGTDVKPFSEMPTANFGGTTAGRAIGVTGSNISAGSPPGINASSIVSVLVAETVDYTNIRNLRARRYVSGCSGQPGFDQTRVSYLNTTYEQSVTTGAGDVVSGNDTSTSAIETFFGNLQSEYSTLRTNTVTIDVTVCHCSCHSSCHGSRGRR